MAGDPELEAMAKVLDALADLEAPARARVIKWINDKLNLLPLIDAAKAEDERAAGSARRAPVASHTEVGQFRDFADLFDAARPSTDVEKALVAGYWVQISQGNADFASQSINDELKQLGHPVSNITRALGGLIDVRPALVQQLRKDGGTKQARKTYRLTNAGQRRVEQMTGGAGVADDGA